MPALTLFASDASLWMPPISARFNRFLSKREIICKFAHCSTAFYKRVNLFTFSFGRKVLESSKIVSAVYAQGRRFESCLSQPHRGCRRLDIPARCRRSPQIDDRSGGVTAPERHRGPCQISGLYSRICDATLRPRRLSLIVRRRSFDAVRGARSRIPERFGCPRAASCVDQGPCRDRGRSQ
jgi:hypothetical protein